MRSQIKLNSPRIQDLIDLYSTGSETDQLNIFPELAKQRALLHDFIERCEQSNEAIETWAAAYRAGDVTRQPPQYLDPTSAAPIIESITRIVERIEKVRAQNAVSRSDLRRVLGEMARVTELHVADHDTLMAIKRGWEGIRV